MPDVFTLVRIGGRLMVKGEGYGFTRQTEDSRDEKDSPIRTGNASASYASERPKPGHLGTGMGKLKIELRPRGNSHCRLCHRPLTDPESVARGIGPVCAQVLSLQPELFEEENK